jgi:hypothetical protein
MMEFTLDADDLGRLVSTLSDASVAAMITASNMPAAGEDLASALEDARASGHGECLWREFRGEYRWILRRNADRLAIVVFWSTGTVTGWEYVFRAECDFAWFAGRVRADLDRLRDGG